MNGKRRLDEFTVHRLWLLGSFGPANGHIELPIPDEASASKQGCVIPGSGVSTIAHDLRILELELVVVTKPNYQDEINRKLQQLGYTNTILVA